jgi:hypothetical protein
VNVLFDELAAAAAGARQKVLTALGIRQLDRLAEQVPSVGFLEGEQRSTLRAAASKHVDLGLLGLGRPSIGRGLCHARLLLRRAASGKPSGFTLDGGPGPDTIRA